MRGKVPAHSLKLRTGDGREREREREGERERVCVCVCEGRREGSKTRVHSFAIDPFFFLVSVPVIPILLILQRLDPPRARARIENKQTAKRNGMQKQQ
jgi:hypothetical protein